MCSIEYYNDHVSEFYERTIRVDVSDLYEKFLPHLPKNARILDAGCGVGRDTKYFVNLGYEVIAFDASIEMVKKAKKETKQDVLHLTFQDLNYKHAFDAIWANASLLHVPYEELRGVLEKLHLSLKPDGILFASFKYGHTKREAGQRLFFDMDEKSILPYINGLFNPIEVWKSDDTRSQVAASPYQAWLSIICRATNTVD